MCLVNIFTVEKETCLFAKWCNEGVDNTLIPSFYFYQMNECPSYTSWLVYDDYYHDENYNAECDTTEYGCCKIKDIECNAAYNDGQSYSFYQLTMTDAYRGSWITSINKLDEEGTNCPTVEDFIYRASMHDKDHYKHYPFKHFPLMLGSTVTAMIMMVCLPVVCGKRMGQGDYETTNSDDVENPPESGSRISVNTDKKGGGITMKESV